MYPADGPHGPGNTRMGVVGLIELVTHPSISTFVTWPATKHFLRYRINEGTSSYQNTVFPTLFFYITANPLH